MCDFFIIFYSTFFNGAKYATQILSFRLWLKLIILSWMCDAHIALYVRYIHFSARDFFSSKPEMPCLAANLSATAFQSRFLTASKTLK